MSLIWNCFAKHRFNEEALCHKDGQIIGYTLVKAIGSFLGAVGFGLGPLWITLDFPAYPIGASLDWSLGSLKTGSAALGL